MEIETCYLVRNVYKSANHDCFNASQPILIGAGESSTVSLPAKSYGTYDHVN